jgi:hypothetical protein
MPDELAVDIASAKTSARLTSAIKIRVNLYASPSKPHGFSLRIIRRSNSVPAPNDPRAKAMRLKKREI